MPGVVIGRNVCQPDDTTLKDLSIPGEFVHDVTPYGPIYHQPITVAVPKRSIPVELSVLQGIETSLTSPRRCSTRAKPVQPASTRCSAALLPPHRQTTWRAPSRVQS